MDKNTLMALQDAVDAADAYVLGFLHRGMLYKVEAEAIPSEAVRLTTASTARGGLAKLRLYFPSKLRKALIASGKAELLGGAELLDGSDKYNRGDRFERLIAESLGLQWHKSSLPCWEGGDLTVGGRRLQVKLSGATVADEATLRRRLP